MADFQPNTIYGYPVGELIGTSNIMMQVEDYTHTDDMVHMPPQSCTSFSPFKKYHNQLQQVYKNVFFQYTEEVFCM